MHLPHYSCYSHTYEKQDKNFIANSRKTIISILNRSDPRILLIVGPCSIRSSKEALEYAEKLKVISKQYEDLFFIIMRAYCEKPRTLHGWQGFLHNPELNNSNNANKGIQKTIDLFLEITKKQVPIACEIVDPIAHFYYSPLLSWGCIGARTVNSPIHRHIASLYNDIPFGFKNSLDGNIINAINAVKVAREPQSILNINSSGMLETITTSGNPNTNIVLRGSNNKKNYSKQDCTNASYTCFTEEINSNIIIDCSHGNCNKNYKNQHTVFKNIISQIQKGSKFISGIMLESDLLAGNQKYSTDYQYGKSITDPCLSFEETVELIDISYHFLKNKNSFKP